MPELLIVIQSTFISVSWMPGNYLLMILVLILYSRAGLWIISKSGKEGIPEDNKELNKKILDRAEMTFLLETGGNQIEMTELLY
jgi:hypothetical protein